MALFHLYKFTSARFLSSPTTANQCRTEIEDLLVYNKKIEIDFSDVFVTAGFLEQLLIPILEQRGEALISRLFFANCSEVADANISEIMSRYKKTSMAND